ncbi:MAG: hypothetical protein WC123_05230 [Bacilli bacterium]|nr:hypothetical protein [Bacilli bacterium]
MVREIFNKSRIRYLFCLVLGAILLWYGISNIITGYDMLKANELQNLNIIITTHKYLPFSNLVRSLLNVQRFNQVGFKEVLTTILLFIKGLTIIEMIFLLSFIVLLYIFLFKNNIKTSISFFIIVSFIIVYLIQLIIVGIVAFNSFYLSNIDAFQVLTKVANMYIISGIICSCLLFIYIVSITIIEVKHIII